MVISTHLPPPVIIESTAVLVLTTHILCWSCAMCFSAATSSENDHGSMNLASKTAPVPSTTPSSVAAIHRTTGCRTRRCASLDGPPGIALIPVPIEGLGHEAELGDEIAGEVLGFDFAALLLPEAQQ